MKKLIILSTYLLVVAVGFTYIDQRDTKDAIEGVARQTEQRRLEREKRLGPKPYFFQVKSGLDTKEEMDSLYQYLSKFTRDELFEVKNGIEENVWLRSLIDSVIRSSYGS